MRLCHGRSIHPLRLRLAQLTCDAASRSLVPPCRVTNRVVCASPSKIRSMAIPVARVHLAMAHAALPALLPTPPKWKMIPLLPTPPPCVTAVLLQAKLLAKPSRAGSDERWDARKTKPVASAEPSASASSGPRFSDSVRSSAAGHGSPRKRKNTTSPPPKPVPGRADSVERWDAHKKAASSASSSSSSSGKWTISRASSAERWDVRKKCCPPQAKLLDDGESSSTGSNDIEDTEEEILWKPRAMYAGPGFVVAAPESSSMLPMPTAFLVPVA